MARFDYNQRYLDSNGDPLAGGKLYFYESGTTTPVTTYSDVSQTTANANPVVLDAGGLMSDVFFTGSAKLVIKDADDVQINVVDPVGGDTLSAAEVKTLYESNADTNEFSDADETKLDSIEALADVTDATNVATAGALMTDGSEEMSGDIVMAEQSDHSSTPGAGKGYIWTEDTSPSSLKFTDDAGTDFAIGGATTLDYTGLANGEYVGDTIEMVAYSSASQYNMVYRSNAANARYVSNVNTSTTISILDATMGMALDGGGTGTSITVLLDGGYVRNTSWSWTPGAPLYVGVGGALSETRGGTAKQFGIAMTADIMMIKIGPAV